jgi:hypothetical protein
MAEITLWPQQTAAQIVFDKILKIAGMKAHMFKNTLNAFVSMMYRDGYVMGRTNTDAALRLQKSAALTVRVGAVEIFLSQYGRKFLFAQAEKSKLPVALIQKELEALIADLYDDGYVFGKAVSPTASQQLQTFSDRNLTVKLVMKEEISNGAEACPVQAGNGVSGAGSGSESGDSAVPAHGASDGWDQPGADQGLPSGSHGATGADDVASADAAPVQSGSGDLGSGQQPHRTTD